MGVTKCIRPKVTRRRMLIMYWDFTIPTSNKLAIYRANHQTSPEVGEFIQVAPNGCFATVEQK